MKKNYLNLTMTTCVAKNYLMFVTNVVKKADTPVGGWISLVLPGLDDSWLWVACV